MFGKSYILVIAAIVSILLRVQGFHTVSLFLLLALLYFFYKNKTNFSLLTLVILIFSFFQLNPLYFKSPPPMPTDDTIIGKIASIPKFDGNKISFEFNTSSKNKVLIHFFAETYQEKMKLEEHLLYGMKCSIKGKYELPKEPSNDYVFNYKQYLKTKNIHYLFTPLSFSTESCIETNSSRYSLQSYRQKIMNYIKEYFPEESKGIILALIVGDRVEIDQEILAAYQSLGIIHLLAVSGLHVGLFTATLYFILIRLGMTKELTIDILLLLLPVYCILAGAAPSVLRATAMSIVVLVSIRGRWKISSLDVISFVCLATLIMNPSFVFHLGFQLSFLVSYSLIISANTLIHQYRNWVTQLFAVTIIAQCISFPIIIYHFYEFSLLSIPLNLVYIPFVTFFTLPFSFITLISHFVFTPIGEMLSLFFNFVILNVHETLLKIMNWHYLLLTFGKPPQYLLVFYYMAIGATLYIWEKTSFGISFLKGFLLIIAVAWLHWNLPYFLNEGEVTVIDVGQGDSIYIELPRRRGVYLIDTGGTPEFGLQQQWQKRDKPFDVGEDIVLPFLKAKGVRKINKLILTHGHIDHIGGAKSLVSKIQVENLLYSAPPNGEFEKELLEVFKKSGSNIIYVKKDDYWIVDHNQFIVVSSNHHDENMNERSIVLYANIGGLNWLFTGDLEEEGEKNLMRNFPNLNIDVLKVGHHGSHTSTTEKLLDITTPLYALISVGENNRYNHPSSDVISRFKKRNIIVYRTDLHGTITYRFKGNRGFFTTKKK